MFNQICASNDPFIKALLAGDETAIAIAARHLTMLGTLGQMPTGPIVFNMSNTYLANTEFADTFATVLNLYNEEARFTKYDIKPIKLTANNIGSVSFVDRVISLSSLLLPVVREYVTDLPSEELAVANRMMSCMDVVADADGNAYLFDCRNYVNNLFVTSNLISSQLQKSFYEHAVKQMRRMIKAIEKAYSNENEALRPLVSIEESIVGAITAMHQTYTSVAVSIQNNQIIIGVELNNFDFINMVDPEANPGIEVGFANNNGRIYFGYQNTSVLQATTAFRTQHRNHGVVGD